MEAMCRTDRLRRTAGMGLALVALALGSPARADEALSPPPPRFGIGWHVGNGFGPVGGALVVRASRHVATELQLAYSFAEGGSTAFGMVPAVRVYLRPEGPSWYASAGVSVAWRSAPTFEGPRATWVRWGLFTNAGYEWRWQSATSPGLGLLLGAGIAWAPAVTATNGAYPVGDARYLGLNVEAGVRCLF